ncbi:MAG: response regulator transcription factor [Solirubrobacteraceae bacterium]|nr:response regulator transcription factor [Solirubrobacteraceae bacterium]
MTATTDLLLDRDPAVILVVDAHEPSRIGLGVLLQRESWVERCVVSGTIERAAQLAQRHRPSVAVVDVSQLGPFAGSAVAALREARPGLQIVLTAHGAATGIPNPRAIGATSFLPSETPVATIIEAARAALIEEPVDLPVLSVVGGGAREAQALSQRERDVLALLVTGATNREIAAELFLGPDTVKKHASSLYRKLGVRNRTEATQQASRLLAIA